MNGAQRESLLQIVEAKGSLNGRFSRIRRIDPAGGGGTFSLLFSADDSVTGKTVALKFFDPMKRSDLYRLASFHREADVMREFTGQADILQIASPIESFAHRLDAGGGISIDVEFEYFAAELAASNALEAIAFDVWTAEEALIAFRSVCRAVQRVHGRSFAHRDIKPGNILVMPNGAATLGDFGAARNVDDRSVAILSAYSAWPGDYGYAAPEVLAGLHDANPEIARAADVYALGCVLFEIFAGVRLSSLLLEPALVMDLIVLMAPIPTGDRRRVFLSVVTALRDAHPIPSVGISGTRAPSSIRRYVDELVATLADLDYRNRPRSFDAVFRKLDLCIRILRKEAQYRAWRDEKRRRRLLRIPLGAKPW